MAAILAEAARGAMPIRTMLCVIHRWLITATTEILEMQQTTIMLESHCKNHRAGR